MVFCIELRNLCLYNFIEYELLDTILSHFIGGDLYFCIRILFYNVAKLPQ